jgi:hypothetical protein
VAVHVSRPLRRSSGRYTFCDRDGFANLNDFVLGFVRSQLSPASDSAPPVSPVGDAVSTTAGAAAIVANF